MSTATTLIGLTKPDPGTEPFTRSILNDNSDTVDKNMVAMAFCAVAYGSVTKGNMTAINNL